MEKKAERRQPEREIMPRDLYEHYVEGRRKGYVGGGKFLPDPALPGFKVFRYPKESNQLYYYEDRYTDTAERPGNFGGFEVNRKETGEGTILTLFTFGGGLTEEGLKFGEGIVYPKLRKFLAEQVLRARFGNKIESRTVAADAVWLYADDGQVNPWGWKGTERIYRNGILVYEAVYSGCCFLPGF